METVTEEGRIEGALTQGLRLLRQQADHPPISFSPPESPILFSDHQDELFTTADDLSDFDIDEDAVAVDSLGEDENMISPDDQDAESKVEGALTQGLRLLLATQYIYDSAI